MKKAKAKGEKVLVKKAERSPNDGRPYAEQQCPDCGAYGCLVPVVHGQKSSG